MNNQIEFGLLIPDRVLESIGAEEILSECEVVFNGRVFPLRDVLLACGTMLDDIEIATDTVRSRLLLGEYGWDMRREDD